MKYTYLLFAAGIGLLAGCSQIERDFADVNSLSDGDLVEKVIFDVLPIKDGDDSETKASAVPTGSGVGFAWEVTDTVGIFPKKGSQVFFSMESGVGTSSASFDGGDWALKQGSLYVSYYPFVGEYYLDRTKIPVSFAGQKQIGTSSPFVGARYFLATEPTSSKNGVLQFSYNTLNTIINVNATLPAGTYTKASLTIEEPLFVEEGTYSLDEREIVGTKFTNTLEIELEDVVLTEEGTIPIYIMSAPVDLREKEVVVRFTATDGWRYECKKKPSKEYMAGTRYGLTCHQMERVGQPKNVIYYTSLDGNVVTPYNTDCFGANIVSNDNVDGKGVILFDGDVTSIGKYAFRNCSSLTSITIPEAVISIGDFAFDKCISLVRISIPDSVTRIGGWAFMGCTSLTSIEIPDSVTRIEVFTFEGCTSLTSIEIPDSVTRIEDFTFEGCTSLTSIEIPDSVTRIGDWAFECCTSLASITLPDGLTIIGDHTFEGCTSLASITLPEGLSFIGAYAFADCSLTRITIPINVRSIGESAFSYCTSLTSVTFPSNSKLASIGDCAFECCTSLTSIEIPKHVRRITDGAFECCTSLASITLHVGLTNIGEWAFWKCSSLTSITIPSGVWRIGESAFSQCTNLTEIYFLGEPPEIGLNVFSDTNEAPIFVPAESVEVYKTAEYWSDYAERIRAIHSNLIPEAVDLGLPSGIKWASFNLGASKPEEYGDYYAWGETKPYYLSQDPLTWEDGKENGYAWPSYNWCMGENYTLTKYCNDSSFGYNGFTDNKAVLEMKDDAANVNLGGSWRMPTDAEWTELRENCTWTWTTQNGVNGRQVTASNGNSIFLPAAGYRFDAELGNVGSLGDYWSSCLDTESPHRAWGVDFGSNDVYRFSDCWRLYGLSIRPVYAE